MNRRDFLKTTAITAGTILMPIKILGQTGDVFTNDKLPNNLYKALVCPKDIMEIINNYMQRPYTKTSLYFQVYEDPTARTVTVLTSNRKWHINKGSFDCCNTIVCEPDHERYRKSFIEMWGEPPTMLMSGYPLTIRFTKRENQWFQFRIRRNREDNLG